MPHRVVALLDEVQLEVDFAFLHAEALDAPQTHRTHQVALQVEAELKRLYEYLGELVQCGLWVVVSHPVALGCKEAVLLDLLEVLNFADLFASLVDHLAVLVLDGLEVDVGLQLVGEDEVVADPVLLELVEDHREHYYGLVVLALPRQAALLHD